MNAQVKRTEPNFRAARADDILRAVDSAFGTISIMAQVRHTGRSGGVVRHASANGQAASAPGAETLAVAISPVLTSDSRSGPRWLMALADCNAAEMLGAFDAGIG
jgi:hypothetical protein